MALTYENLKVSKIERKTADAVAISFELKPTQIERYRFTPGQYISLKIDLDGATYHRSYSICSHPNYNEPLTVAAKQIQGGKVSTYLNQELKVGDELSVMRPSGNFTLDNAPRWTKRICLIAGGSGITPILSMYKQLLLTGKYEISLIYANKNKDSIIFHDELEKLKSTAKKHSRLIHILEDNTGIQAEKGLLNREGLEQVLHKLGLKNRRTTFFICGPGPMMDEVKKGLLSRGIKQNNIIIEYFSQPVANNEIVNEPKEDGAIFKGPSKVEILLDGKVYETEGNEKTSLLTTALKAGLDAPFSCQGGVCSTCRVKVIKGVVKMDQVFGISEAEIKQGYALSCSSFPRSREVQISYDDV